MSNAIAATYHHRETAKILRCEPADPVSYDITPAACRLAAGFAVSYFVQFLAELSGTGDALQDEFTAACRNHADAVAMPAGGPWPVPMPAAWACEEPIDAEVR